MNRKLLNSACNSPGDSGVEGVAVADGVGATVAGPAAITKTAHAFMVSL